VTRIPAELVAQASTAYDAVQMLGGTISWVEGRPDGRDVLIRWSPDQGAREAIPADINVASYVHEYGGGAYLAARSGVWFCDAADQRIYHHVAGATPVPVTAQPKPPRSHRYADLRLTHDDSLLICVRERHGPAGVLNELVAMSSDGGDDGGDTATIASGWDFYSSPRPSPDGRWLAWTCWSAPYMPWDATWLFVAELSADGQFGEPALLAGGPHESVFQPEWSPAGVLHFVSDRSGWWNLYAWQDGEVRSVLRQDAEIGVAQWELGYSTYAFLGQDKIAVIAQRGGGQQLHVLEQGVVRAVDLPYTSIKPYLSGSGSQVAFIASSPTQTPAVVLADVDSGQLQRLAGTDSGSPEHQISLPEPFTFVTRDGEQAHGLYYPPTRPSGDGPPPLIVKAHPGPTANAPIRLDRHTQYFTSRGYAVAEVDYRGSTGYGRAYRQALQDQWGIRDAYDCADAADHLAATGQAHHRRMVIWGASAGGYTALRALALTDVFAAGIARCPVVDPATWRRAAPKFQAHHAEGLIGPWPDRAKIYQERSALHNANLINQPVLIIHGEDDPITPIQESRALADALGVDAELITFPGEGHTLRSPAAVTAAIEAEHRFLLSNVEQH
jgi:dipeptidyl aminopeptidase/acylaminoacyl peptidase